METLSTAVRRHSSNPMELREIKNMTNEEVENAERVLSEARAIIEDPSPTDSMEFNDYVVAYADPLDGFELYKEKSNSVGQLREEMRTQFKAQQDINNDLQSQIDDLKSDVNLIMNWTAKVCLGTLFEVVLKQKLGITQAIKIGEFLYGNQIINNQNISQMNVKRKTGFEIQDWQEMYNFLNSSPSRNQIVHELLPDKEIIKKAFSIEKSRMIPSVKSKIYALIDETYPGLF
jgi:hypothetical protein